MSTLPPPEEPVRTSLIHGVEEVDPGTLSHPFMNLAETADEWRVIFDQSIRFVRGFLAAHDSFEVLSRSVYQVIMGSAARRGNPRWPLEPKEPWELIEPSELEVLQALALMQTCARKRVPSSPRHILNFLSEFPKCGYSFYGMQPRRYPDDPERDRLIARIRGYTAFERNIFTKEDCETVVLAMFKRFDDVAVKELGFSPASMFSILYAVAGRIEQRARSYVDQVRGGYRAKSQDEARRSIEFFCSISPTAKRVWSRCERRCKTLEDYQWAALQISELCHSWCHTLSADELRRDYGDGAVKFFEQISIRPGELAAARPEHFFLNNPIWQRPFVRLDDATFYLPLPSLFYSFPFRIFEGFLTGKPKLEEAYSAARSEYLEETIERYVATGMPSAKTYRKVMWRDDVSGVLYENDVVAVIGNTIFLFEAKSGRLGEAARRGGEKTLVRDFKNLFIEPGEQAARLETYLNKKGKDTRLWIKDTNQPVSLDLGNPKIVHKFSICIEHFIGLTGAKHTLKVFGAITDESRWAPVLALGELMVIWKYLDTEVSFFHYLTRRATLEDVIDFEGDEHDILSMYFINGLFFEPERIEGRRIRFMNIDSPARVEKTPREDRTEFEIYGVPLDYFWKTTLKDIYQEKEYRHRFDIMQVILNQDPRALLGVSDMVRKWRRSQLRRKDKDVLFLRNSIGKRTFVLGYLLRTKRMGEEEWHEASRSIAREAAGALFEASDCALIMRMKRSREKAIDGFSFHRFIMVPREL